MRTLPTLVLSGLALALASCIAPTGSRVDVERRSLAQGPRVLGVIAHPDDELAFGATLYRLSHQLDATCDLLVITNGEGGFKYSTLAEPLYGIEITDEATGRAVLPEIRRKELLESARILGVSAVTFLGENDHRYTTDVDEVLGPDAKAWDLARVRRKLAEQLASGRYDYVFALAPSETSHAHHKAATALAAEAVLAMDPARRPVMLVSKVRDASEPRSVAYAPENPSVKIGPFVLDRRDKLGHQDKLDYGIVVNWAIAAHKSQGSMQLYANRGDREEFTLFGDRSPSSSQRAEALFTLLRNAKPPVRDYTESAGTNYESLP
jgi:LmbE family N-acetylglucosaminyl deacetylase